MGNWITFTGIIAFGLGSALSGRNRVAEKLHNNVQPNRATVYRSNDIIKRTNELSESFQHSMELQKSLQRSMELQKSIESMHRTTEMLMRNRPQSTVPQLHVQSSGLQENKSGSGQKETGNAE